jgi:hypothetical protein
MTIHSTGVFMLAAIALAGCSGDAENSEGGTAGAGGADGGGADTDRFLEVIAGDWTIGPGEETYHCIVQTLTEDMWVTEYRPLGPPGTHHTTLGYIDTPRADGAWTDGEDMGDGMICNGGALGDRLAFAGAASIDAFAFPDGIAVKLSAGDQVLLNMHIANPSTETLSGRTGFEVAVADPAEVTEQADILFVNNVFIGVTPGQSSHTGVCTLDTDATLLAVIHHMHSTGTHMKTRALPAGGDPVMLLDEPFVFAEQRVAPLEPPFALAAGDQVEVTCDYENPGATTLTFGQSSWDSEMCISIVYRYPASSNFHCFAGPPGP